MPFHARYRIYSYRHIDESMPCQETFVLFCWPTLERIQQQPQGNPDLRSVGGVTLAEAAHSCPGTSCLSTTGPDDRPRPERRIHDSHVVFPGGKGIRSFFVRFLALGSIMPTCSYRIACLLLRRRSAPITVLGTSPGATTCWTAPSSVAALGIP